MYYTFNVTSDPQSGNGDVEPDKAVPGYGCAHLPLLLYDMVARDKQCRW